VRHRIVLRSSIVVFENLNLLRDGPFFVAKMCLIYLRIQREDEGTRNDLDPEGAKLQAEASPYHSVGVFGYRYREMTW